ncbi:MAG: peptide deformylase, partial [Thermoguttaceae bacterium]
LNLESDPDKAQEYVFINPVINRRRGTVEDEEGCLSFPEIYAPVKRAEKILVSAYDLTGEPIKIELSGLFARAVQHEYDHLDGILFIDRLSDTSFAEIKDKLAKLESEFQGDRHRGIIPDDAKIATRLAELEVLRS